jgi:hypothetical protein
MASDPLRGLEPAKGTALDVLAATAEQAARRKERRAAYGEWPESSGEEAR